MPQYRLVYYLVYRLPADSAEHASRMTLDALASAFPKAKFDLVSSTLAAMQSQAGKTLYDVALGASGEVTATNITDSLTKVAVPASGAVPTGTATLIQSIQMASIDARVEGKF